MCSWVNGSIEYKLRVKDSEVQVPPIEFVHTIGLVPYVIYGTSPQGLSVVEDRMIGYSL